MAKAYDRHGKRWPEADNVNAEFINPPIPVRHMDWQATFEGYEPGDHIGHGATKEDAIQALLDLAAS